MVEPNSKLDPHNSQEKYKKWFAKASEQGIPGALPVDSKLILEYLEDMRAGVNVAVSSRKGGRAYVRLLSLSSRLTSLCSFVKTKYGDRSIISLKSSELLRLFNALREGDIKGHKGQVLKDIDTLAKTYAAFYHWYMKRERAEDHEVPDITIDLKKTGNVKGAWVYLTEQQVKQLAEAANPKRRAMIYFMFDTGIRSPTELMNTRVSDIHEEEGVTKLQIRDEVSKTFGRKIKLMFCAPIIKEYTLREGLSNDDYLFRDKPASVNKYLKRLSSKLFGNSVSKARGRYNQLTMYDIRHCSACYWLRRYKSQAGLMYRFGWKKQDMIFYYSEHMGLKDAINNEDMIVDVTAAQLEKELTVEKAQRQRLEDSVTALEARLKLMEDQQATLLLERLEQLEIEHKGNLPAGIPSFSKLLNECHLNGQEVGLLRPGFEPGLPP